MTAENANNEHQKNNSTFNWVAERSACSLPKVFKDLMQQVEGDVKARNGLRPANSPYEFSVVERGSDFVVVLQAKESQKSVVFTLAEHAILVRDDKGNPMFEITLTFGDDGECKLHVDQRERDVWQIRRMALEDLMFRGY